MRSVSAKIDLNVPPARVWAILTDFSNYHLWHPYYLTKGNARAGQEIDIILRNKLGFRTSAVLADIEEGSGFTLRIGKRGLFQIDESYSIHGSAKGAQVVHRVKLSGAVAAFVPFILGRRLLAFVEDPLTSLERGFAKHPAGGQGSAARKGKRGTGNKAR